MGVGVRVDEVAEQIGQAEKVAESSYCVVFLYKHLVSVSSPESMYVMRCHGPWTRLDGHAFSRKCSCACSSPQRVVSGHRGARLPPRCWPWCWVVCPNPCRLLVSKAESTLAGCFVLCSRVYPGCTRVATSASLLTLSSFTNIQQASLLLARGRALRMQMRVLLTPNFLNPFILSSWSCISTSSWAEASAVEGSEPRPLLLRAMLPVGPSRRALLV
jgi:hypothetical protein